MPRSRQSYSGEYLSSSASTGSEPLAAAIALTSLVLQDVGAHVREVGDVAESAANSSFFSVIVPRGDRQVAEHRREVGRGDVVGVGDRAPAAAGPPAASAGAAFMSVEVGVELLQALADLLAPPVERGGERGERGAQVGGSHGRAAAGTAGTAPARARRSCAPAPAGMTVPSSMPIGPLPRRRHQGDVLLPEERGRQDVRVDVARHRRRPTPGRGRAR